MWDLSLCVIVRARGGCCMVWWLCDCVGRRLGVFLLVWSSVVQLKPILKSMAVSLISGLPCVRTVTGCLFQMSGKLSRTTVRQSSCPQTMCSFCVGVYVFHMFAPFCLTGHSSPQTHSTDSASLLHIHHAYHVAAKKGRRCYYSMIPSGIHVRPNNVNM